jgi:hypothetical protein
MACTVQNSKKINADATPALPGKMMRLFPAPVPQHWYQSAIYDLVTVFQECNVSSALIGAAMQMCVILRFLHYISQRIEVGTGPATLFLFQNQN